MTADPRFHGTAQPLALAAILVTTEGQLAPPRPDEHAAHPDRLFTGTAPLQIATADQVSYLDHRRYLPALRESQAGAVLLQPEFAAEIPPGAIAILTPGPHLAYARVAARFYPPATANGAIHPTAVVADDARLGEQCEIGPYAVIGAGAELGPGCRIGPHAVIGPGVVLGPGCTVHTHASVSHTIAGAGVVVHPGARVGQEGFGFALTPRGEFQSVPQLGRVLLGDRVEIGANACVDRGSGHDTVLGPGTRLDNLVQIGHNVRTGRGCIAAGMVGVSGSANLGDFVQLGAQSGLVGHIMVGNRARVGAQAGVTKDVPDDGVFIGSPAWPAADYKRALGVFRRLMRGGGKAS